MDSSKSAETAPERATSRRGAASTARATGTPSPFPSSVVASTPRANGSAFSPDRVCAEFEIDDEKCLIVRLDAADPEAPPSRHGVNGSVPREEIARFDVDGSRYALLVPATPRAQRAVRREADAAARTHFLKQLTQRELQIVQLVCAGLQNQQVAERLRISEYTIGSHLKNVYAKLALHARGDLIFRCAQALARSNGNGGHGG
jgi:RNA polymerase sigma factor (sigma-70 family)